MRFVASLPLLLLLVVAGRNSVQAAPGDGGRLNTAADPKNILFQGEAVKNVDTYHKAWEFCQANGERNLAGVCEWCKKFWEDPVPDDAVYGGLDIPHDEWAPASGWNTWLQIGKPNGDKSTTCKTYRDIHGIPKPWDFVEETVDNFVSPCTKPADCTGTTCPMTCPAGTAVGYYPSPDDCKAYCHCGASDAESYWKTVENPNDDDIIWNPWYENSDPLNEKHIPLG